MNLQDLEVLINLTTRSKKLLGEDYMAGSPAYGVIRYQIPDWNITITKKFVNVNVRGSGLKKAYVFGRKITDKYSYHMFSISHPDCEVELKMLENYSQLRKMNNRLTTVHVLDDPSYKDYMLTVVGDTQPLNDALVYMKLMASLDKFS